MSISNSRSLLKIVIHVETITRHHAQSFDLYFFQASPLTQPLVLIVGSYLLEPLSALPLHDKLDSHHLSGLCYVGPAVCSDQAALAKVQESGKEQGLKLKENDQIQSDCKRRLRGVRGPC